MVALASPAFAGRAAAGGRGPGEPPPPAPAAGCFGLACLVTWIGPPDHLGADQRLVRNRLRGALVAGAQRQPARPPRPRMVAPAAIRVFMLFTTDDLLAEVADRHSARRPCKRSPGTGKGMAKPRPHRLNRAQTRRYSCPWTAKGARRAHPRRRGRGLDLRAVRRGSAASRLRAAADRDRGRGAGAGRAGGPRPGDARPRPARRRRPRCLPRAAPALRRADRDADRARHRDGQDRRPRAGRRRLRGEAVQRRRGDLADPRRAAAQRPARRPPDGADRGRRAGARPGGADRPPARRRARPLAQGVRPAGRADAPCRPCRQAART